MTMPLRARWLPELDDRQCQDTTVIACGWCLEQAQIGPAYGPAYDPRKWRALGVLIGSYPGAFTYAGIAGDIDRHFNEHH